MSNSLDPDQAGCYFGPDLGPNCLQTTLVSKALKLQSRLQRKTNLDFQGVAETLVGRMLDWGSKGC